MAVEFRQFLKPAEGWRYEDFPLGETVWEYTAWEVGLFLPSGELVGGLGNAQAPEWWPAGQDVWAYATPDEINGLIETVLGLGRAL